MCIRKIAHWLPCCHQRCTGIELCPDALAIHSAVTKNSKEPKTEETHEDFNPFDCPNGGPVFHDQASEGICPVCQTEEDGHSVDGDGSDDDGHREAEEAEVSAALSWESFFDRYS